MNLGQLLGIDRLRIMQIEDDLAAAQAAAVPRRRVYRQRDGLPKRVIELLKDSDRPLDSKEMASMLGCEFNALCQTFCRLLRAGHIRRQGPRRHYVYSVGRPAEAA